jgi:hypothetical protein
MQEVQAYTMKKMETMISALREIEASVFTNAMVKHPNLKISKSSTLSAEAHSEKFT